MSNFQTLSSLIWNVADNVLRGLFKPHGYGDVIFPFVNFRNYINGFSKNVYDIIENFQLDKPVEKQHKNNRLFLLVGKFSSVELKGKGKIRPVFDLCCGTGGMVTILITSMITNPPFGVSWESEEEFVTAEAQNSNGRCFTGTPRTSDGSLQFLQHMILFNHCKL